MMLTFRLVEEGQRVEQAIQGGARCHTHQLQKNIRCVSGGKVCKWRQNGILSTALCSRKSEKLSSQNNNCNQSGVTTPRGRVA